MEISCVLFQVALVLFTVILINFDLQKFALRYVRYCLV